MKHREYEKSKKSHAKLMGLAPSLLPMIEGLTTVCKITPAASLELFRFKILLFQRLEDGSAPSGGSAKPLSLADALEALVIAGFYGQIQRQVTANNDPKTASMRHGHQLVARFDVADVARGLVPRLGRGRDAGR